MSRDARKSHFSLGSQRIPSVPAHNSMTFALPPQPSPHKLRRTAPEKPVMSASTPPPTEPTAASTQALPQAQPAQRDLFCHLYVAGAPSEQALAQCVDAALRRHLPGSSCAQHPLLDVTVRAECRHLPLDDAQDDFVRWRHHITADAATAAVDFDRYLHALAQLVADLRAQGLRVVAACDFEDELNAAAKQAAARLAANQQRVQAHEAAPAGPQTASPSKAISAAPPAAPPPSFWRTHWGYVLWLLALLALAATQTGSIMLASTLLMFTAWLLLARLAWQVLCRRWAAARHSLLRLLLCALAAAAVWGITQWRAAQWRAHADGAVAAIWQWHGQRQQFPPDVAALRLPPGPRLHYGFDRNGQPYLFYRSAWNHFDTWYYDFAQRQWRFQPD